jgi:hypothetical protein
MPEAIRRRIADRTLAAPPPGEHGGLGGVADIERHGGTSVE